MKSFARSFVATLLALAARAVIRKYRPKIVMVTGSVGKTSTKDAVAAALSSRYYLRASEKSYNSEFGVPLTILGAKNPWNSSSAWLNVFREALALLILPAHYPKLLVLEVGADRPGDLRHILTIASPDAVVVTRLPDVPVHVEAYASAEAVREEEFLPALALPKHAPLVICSDDAHAMRLSQSLHADRRTFGAAKDADVRLGTARVIAEGAQCRGMEVDASIEGKTYTLTVRGALGVSQVYAPAAAVAVALGLGLSVKDALKGLDSYLPPPGRARILKGKQGSTLIDDTYNSSPAAVEAMLASMKDIPGRRRIAVLGDMLELGRYSQSEHERIGSLAASMTEVVVAVGSRARAIAKAAAAAGAHTIAAADAFEALRELQNVLQEGDVVLIKGSQGIRLEHTVKGLLADSTDARNLVRQEPEWLNKP